MNIIFQQKKTLRIVSIMKGKTENNLHFACGKCKISFRESEIAGGKQQKNSVENIFSLILENTCNHGESAYNLKGT